MASSSQSVTAPAAARTATTPLLIGSAIHSRIVVGAGRCGVQPLLITRTTAMAAVDKTLVTTAAARAPDDFTCLLLLARPHQQGYWWGAMQ
ncbi:hypothetical protein A8711_08500 [Micromonospora sp. II]|nr:hypothetical protein A8711_08500 [Micromonospora sp. II]